MKITEINEKKTMLATENTYINRRSTSITEVAEVELDVCKIDNVNVYCFYDETDTGISFSTNPKLSDLIKNLKTLLEKYGDGYVRNTSSEYTTDIESLRIVEEKVGDCEMIRYYDI